jgi:hypothetical protein
MERRKMKNSNITEIWKPIHLEQFRDRYHISNFGRIRMVQTKKGKKINKICNLITCGWGYAQILLYDSEDNMKTSKIHNLVAEAFIPKPESDKKLEVNHIDEDKLNNHVDNLEWVTHSENMKKYYDNRRARGDENNRLPMGFLDEHVTKNFLNIITELYLDGYSCYELQKMFRIDRRKISQWISEWMGISTQP